MLTGTWIPQGAEFEGQALPLPAGRWCIEGERYWMEGSGAEDEGRLQVNTEVTPHQIDIVMTRGPGAGRTIPAIFRLRGNLLQLCYKVGDEAVTQLRPAALGSQAGSMQLLVRYRRET